MKKSNDSKSTGDQAFLVFIAIRGVIKIISPFSNQPVYKELTEQLLNFGMSIPYGTVTNQIKLGASAPFSLSELSSLMKVKFIPYKYCYTPPSSEI